MLTVVIMVTLEFLFPTEYLRRLNLVSPWALAVPLYFLQRHYSQDLEVPWSTAKKCTEISAARAHMNCSFSNQSYSCFVALSLPWLSFLA